MFPKLDPSTPTPPRTIGAILDEDRGVGRGFDFLRVALAYSVVTWHTPVIANASFYLEDTRFFWFCNYAILAVFFSLSGFLITGSALRLGLRDFLINRGLRIFPALGVEIVLSALILGTLFTSLDLTTYFSSVQTYRYLSNIVGLINYLLPGVFDANPVHEANISLWTVPYELGCYAIMSALIAFRLLERRSSGLVIAAVILAVGLAMLISGYRGSPHGVLESTLDHLFFGRGSRLFIAFTLGIVAYLYRYSLPYSYVWLAMATGLCLTVGVLGTHQYPFPLVNIIVAAPLAYITAFLGVSGLPKLPFFHCGDYSYGVYLYGWPVMQAMRGWFPNIGAHASLLWLISVVPITLFAALSWHVIEKPILRLRKKFSFVARQRLAESPPDPKLAGAERDQPLLGPDTAVNETPSS